MIVTFFTLLVFLELAYFVAILLLKAGLEKLPAAGQNQDILSVSVIIAARNEEENIETCLRTVLQQDYPSAAFEVLVIDDRSDDQTATLARKWAQRYTNLKLLQIREEVSNISPKKRALQLGISRSRGKIIVTTDADCTPGPGWLTALIRHFEPTVGMVAGYNPYKPAKRNNGIFPKMLALDYFAMAAVAAAGAGLKFPLSCSGGNLAYRKALYDQLDGYANTAVVISGDDDLFLERVRQETNWEIRYCISSATFVPTRPPAGIRELLNQRFRYASKGRFYAPKVKVALVGVFLVNLGLVLGPLLAVLQPQFAIYLVLVYIIKSAADFVFLKRAGNVFSQRFAFHVFALTSLLHPLYLVIAAMGGRFATFDWKGRQHKSGR